MFGYGANEYGVNSYADEFLAILLGEALQANDFFDRVISYIRDYSENVSVTDTLSNEIHRLFDEAFSTSESLTNTPNKAMVEDLAVAEFFSKIVSFVRIYDENIDIDPVLSNAVITYLAETFNANDSDIAFLLSRAIAVNIKRKYFGMTYSEPTSERDYFSQSWGDLS